jgi:hypothetical protein
MAALIGFAAGIAIGAAGQTSTTTARGWGSWAWVAAGRAPPLGFGRAGPSQYPYVRPVWLPEPHRRRAAAHHVTVNVTGTR